MIAHTRNPHDRVPEKPVRIEQQRLAHGGHKRDPVGFAEDGPFGGDDGGIGSGQGVFQRRGGEQSRAGSGRIAHGGIVGDARRASGDELGGDFEREAAAKRVGAGFVGEAKDGDAFAGKVAEGFLQPLHGPASMTVVAALDGGDEFEPEATVVADA